MKITFVMPQPDMSGGNRVIAVYAQRLKKRGHEVCMVCAGPRPLPFRHCVKSFALGRGWPRIPLMRPSHFDRLDIACTRLKKFRPIVDSDVPDGDVVVATWWETAEWVAGLSPSKGAKAYFMQDYGGAGQPIDKVRQTWRLPLHIITISNWLCDLVLETRNTEVIVVPNSVDLDVFDLPPRNKPVRSTVGFLYTPLPQKGADICIKAVDLARARIPNLRVVAFGSRPATDELPLPEGTEFACRLPDGQLKSIYGVCTAWLFGTRREGFGLPILEAMACRTPVIGTPAGASPELLSKGGGILVKPEDAQDMARAIERVHSLSDAEWRAMSDLAYATATGYTWQDATDAFERALNEAIERTKHKTE